MIVETVETAPLPTPAPNKRKAQKNSWLSLFSQELPFAVGAIPFIWQILFFFLPLVLILSVALVTTDSKGHLTGISFQAFHHIFSPQYLRIALNSLSLASTTTLLCLLLGFPLAYFINFHAGRLRKLLLFLLIIPFWTNFILHIYAWFFVLEKHGFLNNLLMKIGLISAPLHFLHSHPAIYLMMVYFYLPFMVLPIYSALERINPALFEASLDLGANRRQTIRRILLPLSMNAIKSGIFLVFIPAYGEFVIPELMGGDKVAYIGNVISLYILGEGTASYGIAFTIICTLLLLAALYLLNKVINKSAKVLAGGQR